MTSLTKAKVQQIADDAQAALAAVAEKHGLAFQRGRGKYSSTEFNFKGVFAAIQTVGDGATVAVTHEFQTLQLFHPEFAGKLCKFQGSNRIFRVVGYNRRAKSMPILLEATDGGKNAKCPARALETATVIEEAAAA
jgi:hypothetical protein